MYGVILSSPSKWGSFRRSVGVALAVALCLGTVSMPGVWAATFYVDAVGGSDGNSAAQAQSPGTPWQTITRAIGELTLAPGDDIQVAAGTYDQALETFPLYLVDGVLIQGAGPATTTISGPGASVLFQNANTPLASGTTLSGFTLTHDAAHNANVGMSFTLASAVAMVPQVSGNDFVGLPGGITDLGINIVDSGSGARSFTGLIEGNSFSNFYQAVREYLSFAGTPADFSPSIRGNTITDCRNAVRVNLENAFEGTVSPVIADNQITGSLHYDLDLECDTGGSSHGATMAPLISGNTVSGGSSTAIVVSLSYLSLSAASDVATFSPTVLNNIIDNPGIHGIEFNLTDLGLNTGTLVTQVTIAGNTISSASGFAGIIVDTSNFGGPASIDADITIANNTISGVKGIDVEVNSNMFDFDGSFDLTIAGNTINAATSQGIEITVSSYSNCNLDVSVTVQGNTVTGSGSDGLVVKLDSQTSYTASHVDVLDNVVDGSGADGMYLAFWDFTSGASYVQVACNTVTNSTQYGVKLYTDSAAPPPDFGGGPDLASPGLNTFTGNTAYDFYNNHAFDVDAHSNWWGTTDDTTIASHIYDYYDDGNKGEVLYSGWLDGPPTVLATASLSDFLQNDIGVPGPSAGDTIRYTASLEGTGQCGCASAVFTVPIPGNGTFIPGSLTADRGILINDSVSSLHPELIVGLGALEASETVTITWDVMAGSGCSMTSQATLSCYQLGDVLTDDPDAGGGSDPTTVTLDHLFCDGFESGDTTAW